MNSAQCPSHDHYDISHSSFSSWLEYAEQSFIDQSITWFTVHWGIFLIIIYLDFQIIVLLIVFIYLFTYLVGVYLFVCVCVPAQVILVQSRTGRQIPWSKSSRHLQTVDVDAGNQTGVPVLKLVGNLLPASSFGLFETKSHTVTQDDLKHVGMFSESWGSMHELGVPFLA